RTPRPAHPAAADLAAAADVAARLGFETSAMNLPMNGEPAAVTIFIGARSLAGSSASVDAIGGTGLKPGDGVVTAFTVAGKPAFAVLGADEGGLAAAAVMLAGHLPYIWDQKGPTTDKVADDVKQFLAAKGVTASSAAATAIYVRRNTDGADRIVVDLQLANGGDLVKAMVALNQFKATGTRDAKRPLSYANARTVLVRLRAPGSGMATVDLPKAAASPAANDAPAAAPPARRPGGGAKDNFDLSSFYANEGALGDSDNNLIPDRVDVLLSPHGDGADGVVDLAARLGLEST